MARSYEEEQFSFNTPNPKKQKGGEGRGGEDKKGEKKMRWLLKTVLDEFRTLVMLNFHW
jgi:hypothetical protein